ncbi:hypothetical protein [Marinomonas sp. TW1]|uniref:hypothetical protein n=1 Tax=Marinomonas sp. TW1 TaxID=1561203 RepID=UPI0007AF4D6B|nr:hypothetical protein [Marinomonas sp. TW1]KZN12375.1 hypothetical protein OA79_16360 [Marinomonas sp. TW1]
MTALIVICIVLSLMGSALWIMPPKKERQRMALRMQARQLNLTVQLTSIDLPDKWDKSMIRKKVVSYSLYRAKPLTSLSHPVWILPYEVWKFDSVSPMWWVSQLITLSERDKAILAEFEGRLEGIKVQAASIDFYWQEQGDEASVEAIAEVLKSLSVWRPV